MNVVSGRRDTRTPFNARKSRTFSGKLDMPYRDATGWLGREDSNLRMAESKSAALPLGYAPLYGRIAADPARTIGGRTIAVAPSPINAAFPSERWADDSAAIKDRHTPYNSGRRSRLPTTLIPVISSGGHP
jgi:hypothetical protein